jgi:hypothetical protein
VERHDDFLPENYLMKFRHRRPAAAKPAMAPGGPR